MTGAKLVGPYSWTVRRLWKYASSTPSIPTQFGFSVFEFCKKETQFVKNPEPVRKGKQIFLIRPSFFFFKSTTITTACTVHCLSISVWLTWVWSSFLIWDLDNRIRTGVSHIRFTPDVFSLEILQYSVWFQHAGHEAKRTLWKSQCFNYSTSWQPQLHDRSVSNTPTYSWWILLTVTYSFHTWLQLAITQTVY